MELNKYQEEAYSTALESTKNLNYMMLGLAGEAGETAGKYKKVIRGDLPIEEAQKELLKEVGDCLWYISGVCSVFGVALEDVAQANLDKLKSRQERGVIKGDGDLR